MDKNEEFDIDFDFEKEYGFAEDSLPEQDYDDDDFALDLDDLGIYQESEDDQEEDYDFGEDLNLESAYEPQDEDQDLNLDFLGDFDQEEDYDEIDFLQAEKANPLENEALTYEEFNEVEVPSQQAYAAAAQAPIPEMPLTPAREQNSLAQEQQPAAEPVATPRRRRNPRQENPQHEINDRPRGDGNPRRKKRSQMRILKEDYLPLGIAGVAALLCVIFIVSAIVRAVDQAHVKEQNEIQASEQAASEAARLDEEAADLLEKSAVLAAGYNYEAAIMLLDTFSGDINNYTELLAKRGEYSQMLSQLVEISDFSKIPNLSFHVLIADPSRAFSDQSFGAAYNRNFVTVDEFSAILEQLYANGYVLVNFDSFVEKTTDDAGNTTMSTNSIYLPNGKKPVMITETLVNYFGYMIDGNDDGVADAEGGGFASKLVIRDGEITCEMVDASGKTVYGAYDLVPILNQFIKDHPDFSYRGARATLAVTGKEGVFGYRTQTGNEAEITAAQQVVQALRDDGYLIACNSYNNASYAKYTAADIQSDLDKWAKQVTPVLGEVDILVYAQGSDISDYNGGKYGVVSKAGFRYFLGADTTPSTQFNHNYVYQKRIMVTGSLMVNSANSLSPYFNASQVLNELRGM